MKLDLSWKANKKSLVGLFVGLIMLIIIRLSGGGLIVGAIIGAIIGLFWYLIEKLLPRLREGVEEVKK